MAKRANVRISLLEQSGIVNKSYYDAKDYNFDKGKLKNRFYEGINYNSNDEAKQAYTALTNLLSDQGSTLGGIEKGIQNKVQQLTESGNFDFKKFSSMSEKEKIYASKEASKQANKQLKDLEQAGVTKFAYEVAGQYNEAKGREKNRFYTGGKFKNEKDIEIHIQNIGVFLNSKTATPRSYIDVIVNRLNSFREKGLVIADKDEQNFLDFLSSKQFDVMKQYADSNQIIETFVEARDSGEDVKAIQDQFQTFINTNLTFDEVQEKLKVAKWNKGGLLH